MRVAIVLYDATHEELKQVSKHIGNVELHWSRKGQWAKTTIDAMRISDEKQHSVDEVNTIIYSCLSVWQPGRVDTDGMETWIGGWGDDEK